MSDFEAMGAEFDALLRDAHKATGGLGATEPRQYALDEAGQPLKAAVPTHVYEDETLAPQPLGETLLGEKGAKEILLPEMTEEETAQNLGTWGKPLVRVRITPGVAVETFRKIIAGAYQSYLNEGRVTVQSVQELIGGAENKIAVVLDSPEGKYALGVRGVPTDGINALTPEMDYFLQILLDPHDGLTMKKKLAKGKITSAKYAAWMRNPAFKRQVEIHSEALLSTSHEALTMLAQKVGEGDLGAIKFQLEVNNRYNPQQQTQVDAYAMLSKIFEIISRNISDDAILRAIANDMQELANTDIKVIQPPRL